MEVPCEYMKLVAGTSSFGKSALNLVLLPIGARNLREEYFPAITCMPLPPLDHHIVHEPGE